MKARLQILLAKIMTSPKSFGLSFFISFGVACALFSFIFWGFRQNSLARACEVQKILESELALLDQSRPQVSPGQNSTLVLNHLIYRDVLVPRAGFYRKLLENLKWSPTSSTPFTQNSTSNRTPPFDSQLLFLRGMFSQSGSKKTCADFEMSLFHTEFQRFAAKSSWIKELEQEHHEFDKILKSKYAINEALSRKFDAEIEQDRALLCRNRNSIENFQSVSNVMSLKCKQSQYSCEKFLRKIQTQTRELASVNDKNTEKFQRKWGDFGIELPNCYSK